MVTRLAEAVAASTPGRELARRGLAEDLADACQLDVSAAVPILSDGTFLAN